jgi:HAD superfamily hydrolase (TIGR01459 family)
MIEIATSLSALAAPYGVVLCDIWGVVHNGIAPFPEAVAALQEARGRGKLVVLISNSPRLSGEIPKQFSAIGVAETAYDLIVTSGDATRALVACWARQGRLALYHLGPARDAPLFDGLGVSLVPLAEAARVVATGLFEDETETPEDYAALLAEIARRNLPFICANPDKVVQRGARLIYCAGALAERLEALGGRVIYPGKPHAPVYELAFARAGERLGRALAKHEILAIGDGLATDILGAERFGLASVFIADGIHGAGLIEGAKLNVSALEAACSAAGVRPIAVMRQLAP